MKTGDKCYALFAADSGDGGEWLVNVFADKRVAENAAEACRELRPKRMTETTTSYRVQELVLL